ncbi:unnamed protein product [Musa acuminata subsp. malaccensis]|uniref:(wild Malaysian banana) hypothetical protein n=1 Tax=Musa acuminata subsp. malaccensis TaxID=214687 RepID=A0A804KH28_MUSAM|nr:unnamed protein product [Musa acuminata subsp. malaccensis]
MLCCGKSTLVHLCISISKITCLSTHGHQLYSALMNLLPVDNQSCYGESKSNYLTTDGSHEGLTGVIDCNKMALCMMFSGVVQVWSLHLFMDLCLQEQQYLIGNAILWSSLVKFLTTQSDSTWMEYVSFSYQSSWLLLCTSAHSYVLNFSFYRIICLAGFGNLSGDMVC